MQKFEKKENFSMLWIFLAGIVGGIVGGMGMGGGTLLIPILTIFIGMEQPTEQAENLIAFIPMSIMVIIVYAKKHLIEFKKALLLVLGGLGAGIFGAILIKSVAPKVLKICFGIFLICFGIFQLILVLFVDKKSEN
ncbi:MAG: sulfite exporter TauE/SafE family protein [Clostridia bacterium]|jgi:hypothetical protein|nr:sulfite exporter TauE/SafE family protein [Clostridia bacterium]